MACATNACSLCSASRRPNCSPCSIGIGSPNAFSIAISRSVPPGAARPCPPTSESHHLRGSADLDVFHCDLDTLLETLEKLGFTGARHTIAFDEFGTLSCEQFPETAPPVNGEHEFGHMQRGDVRIELHRYFPACSYPQGVRQADLRPLHHPGHWRQSFGDLAGRGVLYRDLREHSTSGVTPETCTLVVPDPAMTVFLRCIHLFVHYLRVIDIISPTQDVLALKLADLAEIRDLAQHPRFDGARLLRLVETFGGQDAVDLASSLLHAYFGSEALLFASSPARLQTSFHFPQCLTLWRCWAAYTTPEELLLPASLDTVIERLQPNTVLATSRAEKRHYAVFATGCGQPIERALLHSLHDEKIPVRFAVTYRAGELGFEITFLEPLRADERFYRLDLQGCCIPNGHYMSALTRQEASQREDGYTVRAAFAWKDASQPVCILLLLGLQHKEKPGWFAFDPLLAIPLKIVPT
ncbi:MAG TPA: hypothetical protein VFB21_14945 [Chthonomonadaceae bacterium]|nr:hypothetical protein [Chthonomonadaceae bacterium]